MKIFVTDSGMGGLSVLARLKARYPQISFEYFADDINNPYGEKSADEIENCVFSSIKKLDIKKGDILVVACNTASIIAGEKIQSEFPFKSYFVKPDVKYLDSLPKTTLFLGTKRTCEYLLGKTRDSVILHAPQNLPNIIENARFDGEIVAKLKKLEAEIDFPFDRIYLGCTHFSLKRTLFEKVFGNIEIIDGAELFANAFSLPKNIEKSSSDDPTVTYKCSGKSIEKLVMMGNATKSLSKTLGLPQ